MHKQSIKAVEQRMNTIDQTSQEATRYGLTAIIHVSYASVSAKEMHLCYSSPVQMPSNH